MTRPHALGCALAVLGLAATPVALAAAPTDQFQAPAPQAAVPAGAIVLDQFTDANSAPDERIAAYAGWLAWSHRDSATGGYELMLRNPAGQISPADTGERGLPFDVSLGTTAAGGVAAVFSRCSDVAARTDCRILELPLGGPPQTQHALIPPGGGSVYSPALSGDRLAFLRVLPGGGTAHPAEMFEWTLGSPHLQALKLPRNSYTTAQLKADPGLKGSDGETGQITSLSLTGTRVAYTRVASLGDLETSDTWIQSPGRAPQLIDRFNTGGAATGLRTYFGATIIGQSFYAFRQYADLGQSFVRYSLVKNAAAEAAMKFSNSDYYEVDSAAADQSGLAWSITDGLGETNGTTLILLRPDVTWQSIPRPHPAHLPAY
jgi:hypothetical protein